MKKLIALTLVASIALAGCGDPRNLPTGPKGESKFYPTYGLFNENTAKSDKVCYEISVGNVIWSIILIETVVFPIYFIGWSLFNPVGVKGEAGCGIDATSK
jgi:hypothetical protein